MIFARVAQGNFHHDTHWHIVDGLNDALQRDDGEIKNLSTYSNWIFHLCNKMHGRSSKKHKVQT